MISLPHILIRQPCAMQNLLPSSLQNLHFLTIADLFKTSQRVRRERPHPRKNSFQNSIICFPILEDHTMQLQSLDLHNISTTIDSTPLFFRKDLSAGFILRLTISLINSYWADSTMILVLK